eukprot:SM000131S26739  [mRNA]  locus=s131:341834:343794:+ [translate_table: standard]
MASAAAAPPPPPPPSHYRTLGVEPAAGRAAIKCAYRALARRFHPDVNKARDAAETFRLIKDAYDVLCDDRKRRLYDEALQAKLAAEREHRYGSEDGARRRAAHYAHTASNSNAAAGSGGHARAREHMARPSPAAEPSTSAERGGAKYRDTARGSQGAFGRRERQRTASRRSCDVNMAGHAAWEMGPFPPPRRRDNAAGYAYQRRGDADGNAGATAAVGVNGRTAKGVALWPHQNPGLCGEDIFVLWAIAVLWHAFGTHATLSTMAAVLLAARGVPCGHRIAAAAAWCCGGEKGLLLVLVLVSMLRWWGERYHEAAAAVAVTLWLGGIVVQASGLAPAAVMLLALKSVQLQHELSPAR